MAYRSAEVAAPAKAAHVNMMTDCIIANLPPEGLRSIMRQLLGADAAITSNFYSLTSTYLTDTRPIRTPELFTGTLKSTKSTAALQDVQSRYRCLMGCGHGFESVQLLSEVLQQVHSLRWNQSLTDNHGFVEVLAVIDGDIVQAVTAVQKSLLTSSGIRPMADDELKILSGLRESLDACRQSANLQQHDFSFERGFFALQKLVGGSKNGSSSKQVATPARNSFISSPSLLETVKLGPSEVPRMFMGLWQFSSPAWGSASKSKINHDFRKHVDAGLIAYDMADHYGDSEVTFGQFRSSQPDAEKMFCATKWAVFEPFKISKEVVAANISERLTAINVSVVDLLQFHWQDYNDPQYVQASRLIAEHPHVRSLGLCNFDTLRMCEIIENGVEVVSNQVQFSLIDLRPTFKMADSCRKHQVKLLTYGSLCGGFLADKWLGKPAPNLFDKQMTPSHRKYFEMIQIWGGWVLFQELLQVLALIGKKHGVSISNVAVRWVLDHDYVGAVIVGARMGISEHVEENLTVFSFKMDEQDMGRIGSILEKCQARAIFEAMGDCVAEYRQ